MSDDDVNNLRKLFEEQTKGATVWRMPVIQNPVYVQDERIPFVVENDHGIRPAGQPDTCFYCKSKIGERHKNDCVCVTKKVKVAFTVELEIEQPFDWDAQQIEFRYNESSWCASNLIGLLEQKMAEGSCLCELQKAKFVEVIDETPMVLNDGEKRK